jgi:hypothetical protein
MRRVSVAGSFLIALALALPARADDDFTQHCDRASALSQNDQYTEALKELEAAYAIKQPPSLLYSLARVHRRLGNASAALGYYERFLTAESDPNPEMKAQVEAEIVQLRHILGRDTPPPPVAPPPPRFEARPALENPYGNDVRMMPVRYETHRDRGLIGGGAALLAAGYAGAVITGSLFLSFNCTDCSNNSVNTASAGVLLIPVLGPVLSGLIQLSAAWSLPWILVDGAAQVAGLAMIIVGARSVTKVPVYGDRLRVAPFALAGGGGLIVGGRF